MEQIERVIKGLKACVKRAEGENCSQLNCPYYYQTMHELHCDALLMTEALIYVNLWKGKERNDTTRKNT